MRHTGFNGDPGVVAVVLTVLLAAAAGDIMGTESRK